MMTPLELRQYEFKSAGRNAYKADDVDAFFGGVIVAYEKMYRENAELIKRMGLLADRLERYKHDEDEIKQAVLSAQKAADIIVREAQNSVEDTKLEAEAILAAAKGEAEIIKSDAEKQAVADSELLLSIARDKAESIIVKAKEEAHGILIEANDSASDTVGAATRTITSESIHYEMLKKEVSDFRASILAQYKAHIEMISRLPELAEKEADKVLAEEAEAEEKENEIFQETEITDDVDFTLEEFSDYKEIPYEDEIREEKSEPEIEDRVISFIESEDEDKVGISDDSDEDDKDFVGFNFADDEIEDDNTTEEVSEELDGVYVASKSDSAPKFADIPVSKGFKLDSSALASDELKLFFEDEEESSDAFFEGVSKVESDIQPDAHEIEISRTEEEEPSKSGFRFFRKRK